MNREELVQLRDAIDLALALPDSVRALLAQWLRDDIPKCTGEALGDVRTLGAASAFRRRHALLAVPSYFSSLNTRLIDFERYCS
jgi:hypothetical protein